MDVEKLIGIIKETESLFFDNKLSNDINMKGKFDYVTASDMAISDYLHQRLTDEFPDIGFISEEEKVSNLKDEYWILDPIDGTTNFMHGLDFSAVSLGLCSHGEIIAGTIYIPSKNEVYYAQKGKGAFMNGTQINCSKYNKLAECIGAIEYNSYYKDDYKAAMLQAEKIYLNCCDLRTIGSAAVELVYVASGKLDVFLGRYLKPWDYAAGKIIIEEAGGRLTTFNGTKGQHVIATNSIIYDDFINLMKEGL